MGDHIRQALDEIEFISSYDSLNYPVYFFIVYSFLQIVMFRGIAEVKIDTHIHLVSAANLVFLLHHTMVCIKDGIDQANRSGSHWIVL